MKKLFREAHLNPRHRGIIHSTNITETIARKMIGLAKSLGTTRNAVVNSAIKYFLTNPKAKNLRREFERAEYEHRGADDAKFYVTSVYIEKELLSQLHSYSKREDVTRNSVILTALNLFLDNRDLAEEYIQKFIKDSDVNYGRFSNKFIKKDKL